MQAALTTGGNAALWLATKETRGRIERGEGGGMGLNSDENFEGVGVDKFNDGISVIAGTLISGAAAKYVSDNYAGSLLSTIGVNACGAIALSMIACAASLNYLKWSDREASLSSTLD